MGQVWNSAIVLSRWHSGTYRSPWGEHDRAGRNHLPPSSPPLLNWSGTGWRPEMTTCHPQHQQRTPGNAYVVWGHCSLGLVEYVAVELEHLEKEVGNETLTLINKLISIFFQFRLQEHCNLPRACMGCHQHRGSLEEHSQCLTSSIFISSVSERHTAREEKRLLISSDKWSDVKTLIISLANFLAVLICKTFLGYVHGQARFDREGFEE